MGREGPASGQLLFGTELLLETWLSGTVLCGLDPLLSGGDSAPGGCGVGSDGSGAPADEVVPSLLRRTESSSLSDYGKKSV